MNSDPIVHVVDDDAGIRKSLQMLMESASIPMQAHASAENFLENADLQRPGCIVLDLRMTGMSGLDLLKRLRTAGNNIPVIIISGHADVPAAVRSMKLGAIDLLQKPVEPRVLVEAVRKAIAKSVELQARESQEQAIRKRLAGLTPRELDLLKLVVAGRSNKQIASDLDISIKTVANHRANLMAKTQALNAADLTRISTIAGIRPAE